MGKDSSSFRICEIMPCGKLSDLSQRKYSTLLALHSFVSNLQGVMKNFNWKGFHLRYLSSTGFSGWSSAIITLFILNHASLLKLTGQVFRQGPVELSLLVHHCQLQ